MKVTFTDSLITMSPCWTSPFKSHDAAGYSTSPNVTPPSLESTSVTPHQCRARYHTSPNVAPPLVRFRRTSSMQMLLSLVLGIARNPNMPPQQQALLGTRTASMQKLLGTQTFSDAIKNSHCWTHSLPMPPPPQLISSPR
eukprot:g34698.t1